MQPLTLYAAADNFFTATFFGQTFTGDNWRIPGYTSIDPKGKVCSKIFFYLDGTYKFTITAHNEKQVNKIAC